MEKGFLIIGVLVFFLLLGFFALLFIPMIDIPIPATVRKNPHIRRFFAWDCLETHETKFDQTALQAFLIHRKKNKENDS